MKKHQLKLSIYAAALLSFGGSQAFSQSQFGDVLKGGVEDGKLLMDAYMHPYIKAFGADMNSGWYNTAKTHSSGRPDLTISYLNAFIPTSDKAFDVSSLGLTGMSPVAGTISPTAAGSNASSDQIQMFINDPNTHTHNSSSPKITLPPGTGFGVLPLPNVQLGIGIYKNTDLLVRFIPTITFGKGSVGLFGIGFKHDIKQWIPGIASAPFDWSVLFGYSSFKVNYKLDLQDLNGTKYDDQNMNLTFTNMTFGTIVSKKFSVLTGYLGLGYDYTTAKLNLTGTYPVVNAQGTNDLKKDPFSLDFKNVSNGAKATVGLRLKFGFFTLHGDYTLAKYPVVAAGFGISIGN